MKDVESDYLSFNKNFSGLLMLITFLGEDGGLCTDWYVC